LEKSNLFIRSRRLSRSAGKLPGEITGGITGGNHRGKIAGGNHLGEITGGSSPRPERRRMRIYLDSAKVESIKSKLTATPSPECFKHNI